MFQITVGRLVRSLSPLGLLTGALFLAASLTPSLIPRDFVLQGALSGLSFAIGYLVGHLSKLAWAFLELPQPSDRTQRAMLMITGAVAAAGIMFVLWRSAAWQDSIRLRMDMPPVDSGQPFEVGAIAILVFILILAFARLVKKLYRLIDQRLARHIPRRTAALLGAGLVIVLLWSAANGILFRSGLRVADISFRGLDALIEADVEQPTDPKKTGSAQSLLAWDGLGRMGRSYITSGPSAAEIEGFAHAPAKEPIRVYAGLNSAETVEERAALALAELKRVGAFERSVLVIITPTGTGWIDPAAVDPLEYLHRGDVASVGVQYSYLASWLSLIVEPEYGSESARALFQAVYGHWTSLPRDNRPRLYVYGLSLGALSSDRSADIYDIIADPFQGALWVGPPFPSRTWRAVTNGRLPESPAWLPHFRDGSIVRFANQDGWAASNYAPWGPIRVAYLQYASDPIVFFEPASGYREPQWMHPLRGPDVSPALSWFPIVTLLQLGLDIALGTTTPMGFGHVYAPEHHIDPWIEVTQPPGWAPDGIAQLKAFFKAQRG